jgi:hypothetical protein
MHLHFFSAAVALVLASGAHAAPACDGMRLGYIDQHRPPFYMGNGAAEQMPPGAAVDLAREMAGVAGCPLSTLRLPAPRIRVALARGQVDVAQIDADDSDTATYALPMNKGVLDRDRALAQSVVVFVRASDKLPANTDPARFFKTHKVGVNHGARYAPQLRTAGVQIDDGAIDAPSNLEKVLLGRIDGFAVTLSAPASMDEFVNEHYGGKLVRLSHPLLRVNAWFAVNKAFYAAHRAQVEAMWDWVGANGPTRYTALQKRYAKD